MKINLFLCICLTATLIGCGRATPAATPGSEVERSTPRTPLVVFAAGSLISPFDALETAFERQYPHIDLRAEYHGSIQAIRHVTELHDDIDVVASADESLIPMLMYEVRDPETGRPYADWYIRFASNRLALAYTPPSRRADEIDARTWPDILADRSVRLGLSDPRFDALGYRALMVFALAQEAYGRPTLFNDMFGGRFTYPLTLFWDDDLGTITVPEIVETHAGSDLLLRGSSIQLIALLQSGDIDYAFEYESVIRQHGLSMLSLPKALNMGDEQAAYDHVQVYLDFRRFASVQPRFRGGVIGYGITIPTNARHAPEAALFIAFLLGPQGREIMAAHHHPLLDPPLGDGYAQIPASLQALCEPPGAP